VTRPAITRIVGPTLLCYPVPPSRSSRFASLFPVQGLRRKIRAPAPLCLLPHHFYDPHPCVPFSSTTCLRSPATHPSAVRMEAAETGMSSAASFLAEDDGAVVCAAVRAHMGLLLLMQRRPRAARARRRRPYRGSVLGRRPNKRRDFAAGLFNIQRDYFGVNAVPPVFDDRDYETRLCVPRSVLRRIYLAVKDEPSFQQRISATGHLQARPLQKVVAALRVIAFCEAAYRSDQYVRLSRLTVAQATKLLLEFIVRRWETTYLRRPSQSELKKMMERSVERCVPGCIGSLDCTHWEWNQCPTGMAGAYQSRRGPRGVVVEAVGDEDLWIWHLFVGAPGSLNDINVLNESPLRLDVTAGRWPPRGVTFTVNGITRTQLHFLADGIYPRYAFIVSPHPMPTTDEAMTFNRLQVAIRKDVERLFGVLRKRFRIALHPGRYRSVKQLITTYKAVSILHNMCVESRRDIFLSLRRGARGTNEGDGGCSDDEVLQARRLPPGGVLMGTTVGRTMMALLPPGDLRLAAAAPPARPTLTVLQTRPPH